MEKIKFEVLYFEITHFCNQRCKHCYLDCCSERELYPMSTESIKKMVDDFKAQGGVFITITGGEPFARSDIFEVLDYIEESKISFIVASNGLLMNEERVERLSKYRYLHSVHTSILGGNEKDHNYITNTNGYESALRGIRLFHKYGIGTNIQITLAKDYIKDIHKIAEELSEFNCTMKFTPIADVGAKEGRALADELILGEDDYPEFLKEYELVKEKYRDKVEGHNLFKYEDIKSEIVENEKHELYGLEDAMLIVRPNGEKTFSFGLDNYKVFGNVSGGIEIHIDEELHRFASQRRKVDKKILQKYNEGDYINYDFIAEAMMAKYE